MADFEGLAMNLAVMIVLMNVFLFLGGYLTLEQTRAISGVISGVDLTDTNSSQFQQGLIYKDDSNSSLQSSGESFMTPVLDFVQKIPVLGPIITFAIIFFDMIFKATFGVSFIALQIGLPSVIILPIVVLNFLIMGIGGFYFLQSLMRAWGGVR